ncbi:MAG: acyl-CoA dehydrogenase family protein [Pseudomonadota bacterium]
MLAPRADATPGLLPGALDTVDAPLSLQRLVLGGSGRLPLPGSGRTLERWKALAAVGAVDLSVAKLFEGHTDALAILAELGAEAPPAHSVWGTWCAEPPDARLMLHFDEHGTARLAGRKAWCSGAAQVTHAVVSCWNTANEPCLAAVVMQQPGVTICQDAWQAVGMADTHTGDVLFDDVLAAQIGRPGNYVQRPGFWHGGAGIAACWFGGMLGIAEAVRRASVPKADAYRQAHLGAIDVAMSSAAAVLRDAAVWIDAQPDSDAQALALRARLVVEHAAGEVMAHAGRALGAAPFCRDAHFARAMADLPVYLRQSHAERDLAALGAIAANAGEELWML